MPTDWSLHHATCVLLGARAVLIRGRAGAGKSRLALRLIEAGGRLVADDQVWLGRASGRLVARAPETLLGFLEVRGLGPLRVEAEPLAVVGLVADLVAEGASERLPDAAESRAEIAGVSLPRLWLEAADGASAQLIRLCLGRLRGRPAGGLASDSGGDQDARPAESLWNIS